MQRRRICLVPYISKTSSHTSVHTVKVNEITSVMNNDDLYGLNQTSPLRSIYDRGSRSIYAPRTDASRLVVQHSPTLHHQTPQQQQQHQSFALQQQQQPHHQQQQQLAQMQPNGTMYSTGGQVLQTFDAAANLPLFEKHLQALRDIDRRLSLLNERDDLLQAKVQNQELQLERLQQSMRQLFEQNRSSMDKNQQRERKGNDWHMTSRSYDTLSSGQERLPPTAPVPYDGVGNNLLVAVGVAIVILLVVVVALMLAKYRQQKRDEQDARKAQEIQRHVKQAVYDVLSQSQTDAWRNAGASNLARNNSLTNSFSLPAVAFGP